ncbi:helix-turn-helix domain-containing protein [Streptomyces xanthophaeus]|uniref:helix-turn-helix domain-containing protein n=1 Tax=Streptomyces xanthophaeus TaxID=67385 RepID=UPI003865054E|nr:helix-turn-helix domain-containing protein [Streptomyces xanthophaeus]WST62160.1 helix-turn-helix domain-containing protein [Streptomyces xanthophaeus]
MATNKDVAARRALVAQLTRDKVPIRTIADRLGVSKDAVHRDRKALAATPAATRLAAQRERADQAAATLVRLQEAVTAAAAARPAYQPAIDDATAAQWYAQLRDTAAALTDLANTFRDYYPHLTDPTATPDP